MDQPYKKGSCVSRKKPMKKPMMITDRNQARLAEMVVC
jgi:hypothetical protein